MAETSDDGAVLTGAAAGAATLDPSSIMQVGMGFWPSKTLLSAVELGLFTVLGSRGVLGARDRRPAPAALPRRVRLPRRARRPAAARARGLAATTARYANTRETGGVPRHQQPASTSAASSRWPTPGCTASGAI